MVEMSHSLHMTSCVGLCVNRYLLPKEASLMKVERYADR